MNTVGYLYDPLFLAHDLPGHPESAVRLSSLMKFLQNTRALEKCKPLKFEAASNEVICKVHAPRYVRALEQMSAYGGGMLNPDTYVNDATYDAAALAVGAAIHASRAVMKNEVSRAFVLARPPGHHAYPDHGEGFCLFNNVAFAAKSALGDFGGQKHASRVLILDWDVHHGNGTEACFYNDPRVAYISTHQFGAWFYPGTGHITHTGLGDGAGANMNIALPPGVGDEGYARVFNELIAPYTRRFKPDLIVISAGYDAHWRDPLAEMKVSLAGYAAWARIMRGLADELCGGRLVVILEGGYDLDVLHYGALNTFHVLLGNDGAVSDPFGAYAAHETQADEVIEQVKAAHSL